MLSVRLSIIHAFQRPAHGEFLNWRRKLGLLLTRWWNNTVSVGPTSK